MAWASKFDFHAQDAVKNNAARTRRPTTARPSTCEACRASRSARSCHFLSTDQEVAKFISNCGDE